MLSVDEGRIQVQAVARIVVGLDAKSHIVLYYSNVI